ncbi:MAG TPA: SDR family oxidoreductase [Gemmataceae bacterium]|nr:SDR family oxidoreductase [Gemmataceae bacterium]
MTIPTILLTGATGFIGGATLARLLQSGPPCRILLLVRGETASVAASRVRQSLRRFVDLARLESALDSCQVIPGDLTDPDSLAAIPLNEVTHVLHLASNTSFRSVRGVRHTNILGTLSLAHRLRRAPRLQRFLHVSTAYLCGDDPPRIVHEDDYPRPKLRHLVEYTNSKAECEMLLWNTAPELPLIIARPSVVIGHTRLGCGPSASIFWFYRTVDMLRRTTFPLESFDDAIPVDYAAEALLFLLLKPELQYRCYHISAGESSSVTWHEIAATFARCHGERPENPYRQVDFQTIRNERDRLQPLLGSGDEDHLLMALQLYYRFGEIAVEIFDNRRLLAEGMPSAPRFTSYLPLCVNTSAQRSVYQQMLDDE